MSEPRQFIRLLPSLYELTGLSPKKRAEVHEADKAFVSLVERAQGACWARIVLEIALASFPGVAWVQKKKVSAPCFPKPDDDTFSVEFSADGICFEFYAQKKMWALEAFVEGEWHPSAIHFVESELSSAEVVDDLYDQSSRSPNYAEFRERLIAFREKCSVGREMQ